MKKGIYILFSVMIAYSSCKKKEEPIVTLPPASDAVVKSVTQIPSGQSHSYSYDSQGRLERIQNWDGSSTSIYYGGDTVIETNYNDSAQIVSYNTLFLDASGLAFASYISDTTGAILSRSSYVYDASNIKISERTYDASNNLMVSQDWTVLEKNIYTYTISDLVNVQNSAGYDYNYTYTRESTIGNQNMGLKYKGNSSTNLMISLTKHGLSHYIYKYTFDDLGRISTQSAYNHQNELLHTNTYTYN